MRPTKIMKFFWGVNISKCWARRCKNNALQLVKMPPCPSWRNDWWRLADENVDESNQLRWKEAVANVFPCYCADQIREPPSDNKWFGDQLTAIAAIVSDSLTAANWQWPIRNWSSSRRLQSSATIRCRNKGRAHLLLPAHPTHCK